MAWQRAQRDIDEADRLPALLVYEVRATIAHFDAELAQRERKLDELAELRAEFDYSSWLDDDRSSAISSRSI